MVQLAQGPRLRGTLAWLSWLALHLFYLLGGRNWVSTLTKLDLPLPGRGYGGAVIVGNVLDAPVLPSAPL